MYGLLIEPVWNQNLDFVGWINRTWLLIEPVWNQNEVQVDIFVDDLNLLIEPVWNQNIYPTADMFGIGMGF